MSTADLLRRYLESIPDFDKVAELLHENVTFTLFTQGGKTNRGRDRIVAGLRREFASFYDKNSFQLEVLMTFGDATHAGGRFRITAETRLGPYRNDYCRLRCPCQRTSACATRKSAVFRVSGSSPRAPTQRRPSCTSTGAATCLGRRGIPGT